MIIALDVWPLQLAISSSVQPAHARPGATQEVYMREGYKLIQFNAAIEKFSPG